MPFLGVDTATSRGSLALCGGGRVLASEGLAERARHANDLLDRIERLLAGAGSASRDLEGIGVAVGPGSFTGVRVGMATCKGIAYGLGIGLCGVSTLEALALATLASGEPGPASLCAVLEAGRGEVYAALFAGRPGEAVRRSPDRSWRPADLALQLPDEVVLVGDGASTTLDAVRAAGRRCRLIERSPPLAEAIALRAAGVIPVGEGYAVASLRPNYIRPSDAEASRRGS